MYEFLNEKWFSSSTFGSRMEIIQEIMAKGRMREIVESKLNGWNMTGIRWEILLMNSFHTVICAIHQTYIPWTYMHVCIRPYIQNE